MIKQRAVFNLFMFPLLSLLSILFWLHCIFLEFKTNSKDIYIIIFTIRCFCVKSCNTELTFFYIAGREMTCRRIVACWFHFESRCWILCFFVTAIGIKIEVIMRPVSLNNLGQEAAWWNLRHSSYALYHKQQNILHIHVVSICRKSLTLTLTCEVVFWDLFLFPFSKKSAHF